MSQIAEPQLSFFDYVVSAGNVPSEEIILPSEDNTSAGLQALLTANKLLRNRPMACPI